MERKPLKQSDSSNQARSGLSSLKRAWSGSSKDLGAATFRPASSVSFLGNAAPSKAKLSQTSIRDSSPEVFYDGWSSSPDLLPNNMSQGKRSFVSSSSEDAGPSNKRSRIGLQHSTSVDSAVAKGKGRQLPSLFGQSSQELLKNRKASASQLSIFSKSGTVSPEDKKPNLAKVFLSPEQQMVLGKVIDQRQNVFYTGSAGTGKSVLLREIIKELRSRHARTPDAVAVTASTGIAACNVGGTTLHSFAGVGIGNGTTQQLLAWVRKNRKSYNRWMRVKVLIIDEVSMLEADLFDKLEEIARIIRKDPKPFGGIQLVVTGDFFQLPPVTASGQPKFAFEAKCWKSVIQFQHNLTQVFRQKDQTFVDMLNEMRFGKLTQKSISTFQSLSRVPKYAEGITPTELFPRREDVERSNTLRLSALKSAEKVYNATDLGSLPREQLEKMCANFIAPKVLNVKIGAQVMLIKNIDEQLVNGSIGTIVDFKTIIGAARDDGQIDPTIPVIKQEKGPQVKGGNGEGSYTASAGIRSRSASPVKGGPPEEGPEFPYVYFPQTGRHYLCKPDSWKNEETDGTVLAERHQVPLILAWAMSIHKAQGQTIPCCRIDLRRIFEKGQAYVALSRATSLEGLQVLGFDPSKVMAHPRVISWSKNTFESSAPF